MAHGPRERRDRPPVAVVGRNRDPPRDRQRQRPDAREEIGDRPRRPRQRPDAEVGQQPLGLGHRLQEEPRLDLDRDPADGDDRRSRRHDHLAADREARELERLRQRGDLGPLVRREIPAPVVERHVEPAVEPRHDETPARAIRHHAPRHVPQPWHRGDDQRIEHRAFGEIHERMPSLLAEADDDIGAAPLDAEERPPARSRRHGRERRHLGGDAAMAKRLGHEPPFPVAVERRRHVLGEAPPARAEMPADGGHALGTVAQPLEGIPAHLPLLAGQRERHEDGAACARRHAIAFRAEALDDDVRIVIHRGPLRAGTHGCPIRPRSAKGSRP